MTPGGLAAPAPPGYLKGVAMRFVLLGLLALLPGLSLAVGTSLQVPTAVVTATGRATVVPAPLSDFQRLVHQRTRAAAGNGDVTLRDLLARPVGPGVREGDILVTRGVKWDKIARGISRASAPLLVGGVLLDIWNEAGCRIANGQIQCQQESTGTPVEPDGLLWGGGTCRRASLTQWFLDCNSSFVGDLQCRTPIVATPVREGSIWYVDSYKMVASSSWPAPTCQPIGNARIQVDRSGNATCGADFDLLPNGMCQPRGAWTPATELQVEDRIRTRSNRNNAPLAVGALEAAGIPVDTEPDRTTVDVPGSVHQDRGTTTNPDGSTIVRDRYNDFTPIPSTPGYRPEVPGSGEAPGYSWVPRDVTQTYPPGAQPLPPTPTPAPGNPAPPVTTPPGATPPTIIVNPPPVEIETCGLPGKPPCKIDETGTPTAPGADTSASDQARDSLTGQVEALGNLQAPAWSWSFALPSSCAPISLGEGFARWGIGQVDICPWQDRFHDLMSMVWAIATVWLSIGMVGSALRGGN